MGKKLFFFVVVERGDLRINFLNIIKEREREMISTRVLEEEFSDDEDEDERER